MTRTILALLLVFGQFPLAAAARRRAVQPPPAVIAPAAVVTAAHQAAETATQTGVPAVQIAVSHEGRVVYSEAFGMIDKESATGATPRSVLQIASVSKQFTAAAILRLAERGALKLDDRIEKFLPEFDNRGATITLKHLLNHTSGLPHEWYPPTPPGPAVNEELTREKAISTVNARQLTFTPGAQFGYSNLGYLLLGYVIESISGRSYAEFIHEELALPLGLIDTGVCGTANLPHPKGYVPKEGLEYLPKPTIVKHPVTPSSRLLGGGNLCSTAFDLARWSHLLASGYVVLPASYAAMTTPTKLTNNSGTYYGLGIDTQPKLGQPAAAHGGQWPGFDSFLVYFPNKKIAVAVIVNMWPNVTSGPQRAEFIALAVAEAALGAL